MSKSQEIERIFKMRQQFKECWVPQEQSACESARCQEERDEAAKITELIKKIKD